MTGWPAASPSLDIPDRYSLGICFLPNGVTRIAPYGVSQHETLQEACLDLKLMTAHRHSYKGLL